MRGVATVPVIFVLGVLTVAIGVGVTALALAESMSSEGSHQSARALLYAEAGARDALMRIARDKTYACTAPGCYALDLAENGCSASVACAHVSVSSGTGTTSDPKIIVSEGRAGLHARRVSVSVLFDPEERGEIISAVWTELTD